MAEVAEFLLHVNSLLLSTDCNDLNSLLSESVWCKITTCYNKILFVGCVYRSPSASQNEVSELFKAINLTSKHQVLIMGDFNYPGVKWNTLESDKDGELFLDLVQDCFLFQHVREPTRDKNILDLVITSEMGMIENLTVDAHLGNSDHNVVGFNLIVSVSCGKGSHDRFAFHKGNYSDMKEWLGNVSWDEEFASDVMTVDAMWAKFHQIMLYATEKFVPIVNVAKRKFPLWMTNNVKSCQRNKSMMWSRYKKSGSYNDLVEYKLIRNRTTAAYKRAKRNFEVKLASNIKNDSKSFYSYVRSMSRTPDKIGPIKDANGVLVNDYEVMCKLFNDYFGSVFTVENSANNVQPEQVFKGDQCDMLCDVVLSEDIVRNKLQNLSVNKSVGVDGIAPRVLFECASIISKPLSFIFRKSLDEGVVPPDWRRANVTAIFKKRC